MACPWLCPVHQCRSYHCPGHLPIGTHIHFPVSQHSRHSLPVLSSALHSVVDVRIQFSILHQSRECLHSSLSLSKWISASWCSLYPIIQYYLYWSSILALPEVQTASRRGSRRPNYPCVMKMPWLKLPTVRLNLICNKMTLITRICGKHRWVLSTTAGSKETIQELMSHWCA